MTITDTAATGQVGDTCAFANCYLVRIGTMAAIGRFLPGDVGLVRRGMRVICRSQRGLEVGHVLGPAKLPLRAGQDLADGRILRQMTPEDELLWKHMRQLSERAGNECSKWLAERGVSATLLEVEPLMDGKTLYFHFLSDVDPSIQKHLDALVAVYQRSIAKSQFARLLEHGCGPGCGTENAKNGCGSSGGCAVCQIAGACTSTKRDN